MNKKIEVSLVKETILSAGLTNSQMNELFQKMGINPTLAQMNGKQKQETFGMWAEVYNVEYNRTEVRIISSPVWDIDTAMVYWPGNYKNAAEKEVLQKHVTPMPNLGRAWGKDGEPVAPF